MISLHYHDDSDVWTKVHHKELGQDGQVEARLKHVGPRVGLTTLKVATGGARQKKGQGWLRF